MMAYHDISVTSSGGLRSLTSPSAALETPTPEDVGHEHESSPSFSARPITERAWGEEQLERLAIDEPLRLLALLQEDGVHEADLSFAAEKAGVVETEDALNILLGLLNHVSPLVREGAIYGLATPENPTERVLQALKRTCSPLYEPSPGVRAAAAEALDFFGC